MTRTGRPKADLVLTGEEREQLVRWSRRATSAQALALRSKIILGCADGADNVSVAGALGCSSATVGKWRRRFVAERLDGLSDDPRPGAPRSVRDDQVEQVIVATLERTPRDATHWSRSSMAAETGLSESTIGRVWRAFGLKPHLVDTFKLSADPQLIREGPRRRGALPEPGRAGRGAQRRREVRYPGPEPVLPAAADDAGRGRAAKLRLRPCRHHRPVRGVGRRHQLGHPLDPVWDEDPRPFTWTKTADEILERLARYLQRVPGGGH